MSTQITKAQTVIHQPTYPKKILSYNVSVTIMYVITMYKSNTIMTTTLPSNNLAQIDCVGDLYWMFEIKGIHRENSIHLLTYAGVFVRNVVVVWAMADRCNRSREVIIWVLEISVMNHYQHTSYLKRVPNRTIGEFHVDI